MPKELTLLIGFEKPRRQSRLVDRLPKAIAWSREVKAGRTRPQSRVDANEQDAEVGRDDVFEGPTASCFEIGLSGPLHGRTDYAASPSSMGTPTSDPYSVQLPS